MHRICCKRENGRIRSPLTFEHVQNSEAILGESNCCTGSHEHSHNVAQRCVNWSSVARISKVARWFAPLYACVVRPWECCKTCRILSCNVVRSPDYSYDAVASSYNTRFCCTTYAPGCKTYRKICYISLQPPWSCYASWLLVRSKHTFSIGGQLWSNATTRRSAVQWKLTEAKTLSCRPALSELSYLNTYM